MLRIEGFFLYQIFLESITSLKSLITRMHHFSTEIFFLKMFHIKHFIHNTVHRHTDALRGGYQVLQDRKLKMEITLWRW